MVDEIKIIMTHKDNWRHGRDPADQHRSGLLQSCRLRPGCGQRHAQPAGAGKPEMADIRQESVDHSGSTTGARYDPNSHPAKTDRAQGRHESNDVRRR